MSASTMNERIGRSWCIIKLGDCVGRSDSVRLVCLRGGAFGEREYSSFDQLAATREDRKGLVTCGMDECHFGRELYCRQICSRECITRLGLG
jgi:hypothetical protein